MLLVDLPAVGDPRFQLRREWSLGLLPGVEESRVAVMDAVTYHEPFYIWVRARSHSACILAGERMDDSIIFHVKKGWR